ncbi:uncharacterized protein SCHCODRAFT_02292327 [Schizophyllum commune H4-8]|uniref:uncharacterized protein n=1 Tax=Schizophyllum commune (strain H4-8 / FGSC 9210) TaxID=578458 RepID=UPI00215F86A5|nr:uncharacterized protein SCHCODRAFT_02292327 [Schizophyllum commune H4-8]KAI5892475.1 hypothetical protein SCHCODRAFT_02292327 [Schizophyllum commune H4-8]
MDFATVLRGIFPDPQYIPKVLAMMFEDRRRQLYSSPPSVSRVAGCSNPKCVGQHSTTIKVCSKCKLVKYCSRPCQVAHWPTHKVDCNNPYNETTWQPGWLNDRRVPAWVTAGPSHSLFGSTGQYLWGNVPAIDCMGAVMQEGAAVSCRDLNICFAASGDIRNLVSTVNGLPDDYSGTCRILINDSSPCVTTRNLLILYALLRAGRPIEDAAESALHLWYSAILRPSDAAEMYLCAQRIYGDIQLQADNFEIQSVYDLRGDGKLYAKQPLDDMVSIRMLISTHGAEEALASMHDTMLHPSRIDYRDRFLASLQPSHRTAWARNKRIGVLASFADDTSDFTEPNRTMFSPDGQWMTLDSADQLHGWPVQDVLLSGQRSGLAPADVYGCLCVHVRGQLIEFARRMERFRIDIHVSQADARDLAVDIVLNAYAPHFTPGCFDRIETSNVADYIGLARVIDDWGPLLSRQNQDASLLAYTMNWHVQRTDVPATDHCMASSEGARDVQFARTARAMGIDLDHIMTRQVMSIMSGGLILPEVTLFTENMAAFCDTSTAFERWLDKQGVKQISEKRGLRMRQRNRIHPKRFGAKLDAGPNDVPEMTEDTFYNLYNLGGAYAPVRFLEFEACRD